MIDSSKRILISKSTKVTSIVLLLPALLLFLKAVSIDFSGDEVIFLRTALIYFAGQLVSISLMKEVRYGDDTLFVKGILTEQKSKHINEVKSIKKGLVVNMIFIVPNYTITFSDFSSITFVIQREDYQSQKNEPTVGEVIELLKSKASDKSRS